MTIDREALRRLAEKATPGPWEGTDGFGGTWVTDSGGGIPGGLSGAVHPSTAKMPGVVLGNVSDYDAMYIAAINPQVILALLDELEAAEATAERRRALLERSRKVVYLGTAPVDTLAHEIAAELAGKVAEHQHEWILKPSQASWDYVAKEFRLQGEYVQITLSRDSLVCRYLDCNVRPNNVERNSG